MMKYLVFTILTIFSLLTATNVNAASIGFGHIEAIKQYDFNNSKKIVVILKPTATHSNEQCKIHSRVHGNITWASHDESVVNSMLSMAMSAQAREKKVRLYSEGSGCEVDFLSIQESYF